MTDYKCVGCEFCYSSAKKGKVCMLESCQYEHEQTNEEWFKSQDLASMLLEISWKCQKCEHTEYDVKNCPFGRCFKNRPDAEAWLKEVHK